MQKGVRFLRAPLFVRGSSSGHFLEVQFLRLIIGTFSCDDLATNRVAFVGVRNGGDLATCVVANINLTFVWMELTHRCFSPAFCDRRSLSLNWF